ncbi:MAG: MtrB/PioB family decaheme-associated outer membrane protein [Pseudomonadota bacterium]
MVALLLFDNDSSLSWQDPHDPTRTGRMALEPDNQMHQLSATLGHLLSPTNRLSAALSVAHLTQDEKFLPYSTDTTVDSLPRSSLDGEVMLIRGQVKLTSRPMRKLRLSAQYSYDERDNKTATADYDYFVSDGVAGQIQINPRANDPLSYRKNKVDLTANYRINSKMSLHGGYEYKHMHRDSDNQERETTREQTLSAKWKMKATSELNLALYGEASKRSGSTYETRPFENPSLRNYNLADLRRNKLGASINYMPTDRFSLGMTTEYLDDDYHDSTLGLTEAQQVSLLLNATYQISEKFSTHAFYNHEAHQSEIAGAQDGKLRTPDWHAEFKDTTDSVGLGAEFTGLSSKWDVGADLVYTRSRGDIDMRTSITGITNPDSAAGIPTLEQYPDVKNSLTSLQLWTRYQYSEKIAYKFSYWHEDYRTQDWAVDGTQDTLSDLEADTLENFLLLGEEKLDYTQHVVGVSVNVQF